MRRVAASLLVASVWLVGATAAGAESLADVLAEVYETSPRLEAGRASLRAVDESVARARAQRRPQLAASSSATLGTDGDAQGLKQALTLTQSVYSGGETTAAIAQAENQVRAERARLAALEQDVLLEAVAAYTAVAREQAILELARRNEERLRLQRDATRDRERFGDLTKTDIAQAETRHARATAGRIQAEGDLAVAAAEYRRLVGSRPESLTLPEPPDGLPASLDEAVAAAEDSWRWQAASFEVAAARDAVTVSRAGLKPKLSLGGALSYAEDGGSGSAQGGNAAIGATLAVPLYQGGGEYARLRQSKELLSLRRYGREDALRAAEAEIVSAWEAMQTAEAAIRAIQVQVDAAGFALDGVRQEALVGTRAVVDILDAEQELFTAEVDLVRAERERVLAGYRLRAAVGRLRASDLTLAVEQRDPEAHYRDVNGRWFGLGGDVPED
jgi:outer membrane protein